MIGDDLTREDMAKLWSTKDVLGRHDGEILFLHHRLNHCSFKSLLVLSKKGVISNKISKVVTPPPCIA